jgi:signal transduction histidine kinase
MTAPRKSRSPVIVVLLVATLAMTAMLAYEAQQAVRSHRATAENVLRDYSTFASWELTRLARQQLMQVMSTHLERVKSAARAGDLATALNSSGRCPAGCGGSQRMLSAFHATLPEGNLTFAGDPVSAEVRAVLETAVREGLRRPDDFTCPAMRVIDVNGTAAAVVFRPVLDRSNRPADFVGFVSDTAFVRTTFEQLLQHNPLLPPSLMPGANPNSALAVRVSSPSQQRLFVSAADWSPYEANTTLPADFGGLAVAVALRPDAAGGLVIGGLPRERLPLVVGLLTLTAGLVVIAIVQLRREAELSRLRSDFVSGVSHELRTPLAQIRMFTETLLLGRVRTETEGRRSLEIIARESQRLAQLVENVLLFSRGERRRPQITREPVRLAAILTDVVEGFAPLASARQAHLLTQLDRSVMADVDPGAVRQILLNLLDNAVKYGPAGQTVTVALRISGDHALIVVDDQGPGIDAPDADRIWQPFSRLARSATATGGAGIGLAIVRQLAELHGGVARVERADAGARFIVEIPGAWRDAGESVAVA